MSTSDFVLRAEGLTKKVSSPEGELTILDSVTFDLARGATAAIVGPSGAGKSTLLALLAGLDEPTSGRVWLNGSELSDIHVAGMGEGCGGNALEGQWIAPPAFQTLYLGWEHYQQTMNPIDLWMDAIVVDTKRVGCPAMP